MQKPTKEELLAQINARPLHDVVQEHIFDGESWAFRETPADGHLLISHLQARLSLPPGDIVIVGSAKLGYSISPDTFGRAFSEFSDIDVIVIDHGRFEEIWKVLLDWRYPWHLRKWASIEKIWGIERLEQFICGWCMPSEIKYHGLASPRLLRPLRELSANWFDSFKSLSRFPPLASRNVNSRLYRSWDHAMRYHVWSLEKVRQQFPLNTSDKK